MATDRTKQAETTVSSRLDAPPAEVWEWVTTLEGIRDEMRPYLRMTLPAGAETLDIESVEVGKPIGRSWILLFGFLPFDYDDICLVRLEPERGFLERSRMLSQRLWEHERTLAPSEDGGCTITDRLHWQPRIPLFPAGALRPAITWFFHHRHRRLQRRFGGEPLADPPQQA